MKINKAFVIFICLICAAFAAAQPEEKFDFYTRGDYRPNVPRPQVDLAVRCRRFSHDTTLRWNA